MPVSPINTTSPHPFIRTIWKGISIDLPADWELSAISLTKQVERLTFADRYYERLRLTWRTVPHDPDLNAIVNNEIEKESPGSAEMLRNLPRNWVGAVIPKDAIQLTYAASYLSSPGLLIEMIVVWPRERDRALESDILASIGLARKDGSGQIWKAMGMDLKVPENYPLIKWQALVGKLEWQFSIPGLSEGSLTFRRLAMPEYWLKEPLEQWLPQQVEKGASKEPAEDIRHNNHQAWRMSSRGPVNSFHRLLGREPSRLDLAWECPAEKRVYHLTWTWRGAEKHGDLPNDIFVACCNPPSPIHYFPSQLLETGKPTWAGAGTATPQTSLSSIAYRNETMQTESRSDGGLTISIPIKQPRALKPPLSWILPYSTSRRVAIDSLSKELLEFCDGHRTVEAIIIAFAEAHLLTFREASLAVVRQLLNLSERGIVVLVGDSAPDDNPRST